MIDLQAELQIDYSKWIGVPFEWAGEYDCWTLAKAVLAEHGIELPDYDYEPDNIDSIGRSIMAASAKPVWSEVAIPEPLDMVLLGSKDFLHHLGVYVGDDRLLHTTPRTGALVQRLSRIKALGPYRQWRAYRWVG